MIWIIFLMFSINSYAEEKMPFITDIEPYINKYGTINQTPGEQEQNSNNSLLYYGDYIQVLASTGEELPFKEKFDSIIDEYYVKDHVGLLNLNPLKSDHESFDDYIGILSAASIISPKVAQEILSYGKENDWYFDNEHPDEPVIFRPLNLKNYFGRVNGFIAHAYFANKQLPSKLERFRWILALLHDSLFTRDGTSNTRLIWHFVKAYERSGLNLYFCNLTVKIWKKSFWKDFKNGMGDLFGQYFNPEHPYAIYMKGKL